MDTGRPAITSNEVCGNGTFWAFDVGRVTFPNQTQLCNSRVNFTGHPCLVVHHLTPGHNQHKDGYVGI
jgi:hypothetical protein